MGEGDRLGVESWWALWPEPEAELSLAKPGGGEASRESALPTSLLACLGRFASQSPRGLSLLEVHIVGSVQVYDIKGWQYTVVKKTYLLII